MADIEGYVVKTMCDNKAMAYRNKDAELFIVGNAFSDSINKEVPVVWITVGREEDVNHDSNIIGYATLEQKWDGVYARISLRDNNLHTKSIRGLLQDGDINSLMAVVTDVDIVGNKLVYANIEKISPVLTCIDSSAAFLVREQSRTASLYSFAKIDTKTAV